jgi:hypothetical protein
MSSSGTPTTRRPIAFRQVRIMLAVVCALSVISAAAEAQIAPAQGPSVTRTQNFNFKQPIEDVNPCDGTPLVGEGNSHVQVITESDGFTIRTHQSGQAMAGTDLNQRYQYQSWQSDHFQSSEPFEITQIVRKHMIHEGQRRGVDASFFVWTEAKLFTMPPSDPVIIRYDCKERQQ